ncbi:MAG: ABC transporter [Candidatus Omnitrophica bacterium CG11_big_fil_rev_8_21_14_0_20_63_9]|nr:MAG: ABC transporter [Candidatus Omnitrophica bacterium CG11_big_fil_rev_8_21_14_0_20_63_9]
MTTSIEVSHLTKRYDTVTALADVSLSVQPGEIMGFLGPNGAGKTTTLRILTGMLAPTEGSVRIDGLDVTERPLDVRRRIGYLPEHVALYPELRVREYLDYRVAIKDVPRPEQRARVDEALQQCALADVSRKLIGRLSKGYRQRVALADCLLAHPKILILDEPTVGLDPHQIRQTRELITQLGRTTTILLSTHILPEVEMICHRVTIINKGRIVAVDTPAQLRQRLQGSAVLRVQLRGEVAAIESALNALPGVTRVTRAGAADGFHAFDVQSSPGSDIREVVFRAAVERQWMLRELSQAQASLEDVFIQLTTHEEP